MQRIHLRNMRSYRAPILQIPRPGLRLMRLVLRDSQTGGLWLYNTSSRHKTTLLPGLSHEMLKVPYQEGRLLHGATNSCESCKSLQNLRRIIAARRYPGIRGLHLVREETGSAYLVYAIPKRKRGDLWHVSCKLQEVGEAINLVTISRFLVSEFKFDLRFKICIRTGIRNPS
jgi:hypothetical protein